MLFDSLEPRVGLQRLLHTVITYTYVMMASGAKPQAKSNGSVPVRSDTPIPRAVPKTLAAMLCDPILAVTSPKSPEGCGE